MDYFASLPIEIISLIILHVTQQHDLYECALVNKQCLTAINPLMWRTVFIKNNKRATTRRFFNSVATSHQVVGQHIRSINLALYNWTDTDLLLLIPHVRHLEELFIHSGIHITDASFKHVPRYCPHLQSLRLYNSPITHVSIQALGQHCQQLSQLDLVSCCQLEPHTFQALQGVCPLEMIKIRFLSGASWMTANITAMDLAAGFRHLTYLMVLGPLPGFTDRLLRLATTTNTTTAAVAWPYLSFLSLDSAYNNSLNDTLTIPFLQSHRHLTHFSLRGCNVSDATLAIMATYLSDLIQLDIDNGSNITAQGLRNMIRYGCPRLMHVSVRQCGLAGKAFPEARKKDMAVNQVSHQQQGVVFLERLDRYTIDLIRHGALGDNGQETGRTNSLAPT